MNSAAGMTALAAFVKGDRVPCDPVFDTQVRRDDMLDFARGFMRWQTAGGVAYDKAKMLVGLAPGETLRVGHLASINFAGENAERDRLLNGQLPGIITGYLNAMFGLQPGTAPSLWSAP